MYYKKVVDGAGRLQKSSPDFPITEAEKVLTEIQNLAKPIIALEAPVAPIAPVAKKTKTIKKSDNSQINDLFDNLGGIDPATGKPRIC